MRAVHCGPQDPAQEPSHPPLHARAGGRRLPALRHADDRQGGIRPMKTYDRREFVRIAAASVAVAGRGTRATPAFAQAAGKTKPSATDVLLVVDVQNCFVPGGTLPVKEGDVIIPLVNRIARGFQHVVLTQDWHPPGHGSFASTYPGRRPFETVSLASGTRSEEHTSELQSPCNLVCRLLLEKKKKIERY